MGASCFVPYSFGYAIANKEPGSTKLMVLPVEQFPAVDGDITSTIDTLEVSGVDPDGKAYSTKSNTSTGIPCTWLPFGSNRATAPDVRRKERVLIYRWADTDQYFWVSLGLDEHLRRLERVVWVFNANPDPESADGIDFKSCYYLEVSTRDRLVTFGTSKANDEPFAYTIQVNTGAGHLIAGDDDGNFIEIVSKASEIRAHNKFGTMLELVKKVFNVFAPDSITMTAVKSLVLKATKIVLEASETVGIDAPKIRIKGDIEHSGSLTTESLSATTVESPSIKAGTLRADKYQNLP